jgi:hypothetical protein
MAAIYSITTEGEEALAAATAETLVQIRGVASLKARVVAWGVSFDSVTAADAPVVVDFLFQTTDGTGSAATEVAINPDEPVALVTGFHSFSAEPTPGGILESYNVPPQGGMIVREYPPGREPMLTNATSSRLGIRCTAPAVCNAVAWIQWEE